MRGTRFNDVNDITIQIQQHKAYQMHKQRLEKIGNGQYLSLQQTLATTGVGNGTTTNQMLLRSSLQRIQNPSKLAANTYSPHESPMIAKQGAAGRHTSMDVNNNHMSKGLLESSRARNNHSELENKYMTSRIQSIEHKENEKLREIQHENELLLQKLIQIQKGSQVSGNVQQQIFMQLSVPTHLLNSSSRLLQKSTSNFNNSNVVTQETMQSPRQNKQSQKKLRTLNMVQKKLEAQRIDQANLFLLNKITSVASSIDKRQLDSDWNQQRAYRQMIQRAGKKADLNELVTKRQDYLERNFAILPKINYRKEQSQDSLKEKKNEFSGETFANPQGDPTDDQQISMESPRMPQIKIKSHKQKFKYNTLRVSQEPNSNLEVVKTSITTNNASVFLSSDPRKPFFQGEVDQSPDMKLNLSGVNSFDVYKKNKNLISSNRKKNKLDSVKDLHNDKSPPKQKEVNLSDSQKLALEEKTLQNLIKEVESHGILKNRQHGQRTKSDNRITENYEQDNKSASSIVRIDTENIQVFPVPNQQLNKQLRIGAGPVGRTVVHSPGHSPQITQQLDKSSNTTLVPILNKNGSFAAVAQNNGQQSVSKLSQSMRYQQIMGSPRQHATIKKITSKLVNSFSKSRYSYYINKNSGHFKLGVSPSNLIEGDQAPPRGESIMSQVNIGEETYRAESQLQMLPSTKFLESQVRETVNKSALDRLTTIPINLKRELLMPSSNILAALHLGQRKHKKKKPFNMTGRVIAKPMQQENEQIDQMGLPKIAQRSFDLKPKVVQQESEEQQQIIEEDPAVVMTPSLDGHKKQQS